jgi:type I restriction enzyme S subunit
VSGRGTQLLPGLPPTWRTTPVRYATTCLDGRRVPLNGDERGRRQGEFPYWGANGVVDAIDNFIFNEDLVLLGEDGAPFFDKTKSVAFFVTGRIWVNNHIHVLRTEPGFDPRFVAYALNATDYTPWIDGSTRDKLTQDKMGSILLPTPPPAQQRCIANFLDAETTRIDGLVAAKQRLLDLIAEKRKAIIATAVTRGLDPKVKLRDSGVPWLGEIPARWGAARLKFLAAEPMAYGASEPSEFAVPSHPRFIRITDIDDDGSLRDDTFRSLEPDVATPYLLRRGDLLFARSGATVGKTLLFAGEDGSACFAGYLIRFRANTERVLPSFVYAVTQSAYYWWCIREGSIQATIQNFSAEKYGDIVIAVPPLKEQCAIVEHIARESAKLDAVRAATERTIALLRERRVALIAAAVTGQLEVGGTA